MGLVKKYVRRYFSGWKQLNFLWKAGVLVTTFGMVGLLLSVWLTPAAAINAPSATSQRNVLIAMIAAGVLLRFFGAVVHTKQTLMRRSRR